YIDTRRECWKASLTGVKFGLSSIVLGIAANLFWSAFDGYRSGQLPHLISLAVALAAASSLKMLHESLIFIHLRCLNAQQSKNLLACSALLLSRELKPITILCLV